MYIRVEKTFQDLTVFSQYGHTGPLSHKFHNLRTGFYEHQNHAFSFSQINMGVEKM